MDIVSKERLKLYNDLLRQQVPDNNDYTKLKEKTLSCLTRDSLESYGKYIKDVIYYKSHILYCINDMDSLYIKYPSSDTVLEFSGCFGSSENKSIYLYEDSSYYYIYTLTINELDITIKQVRFTKTNGDISTSSPTITTYTGTLSSGDTLYNTEFYVYNNYAYISILNGSTYYIKKLDLSSSITISDLYSSSNPFYIKSDVFDLSYFYVLNTTSVRKISADGNLQSTISLPYTISTTGFIDYFNNYVVYTTNGLIFYITNLTTNKTNMIVCEDDIPLLNSSDIRTLKIKKITGKGELQFYLGLTNGRHIKFYSDTTSFIRLDYSFIDPYKKTVLKVVADPYKNTENILIAYYTQAKQIRILDENTQASGAQILASLQDTTKQQTADLANVKNTANTNASNIGLMQYDINHLTNIVDIKASDLEKQIAPAYKNQGLCGTDSIDNYKTYGVYSIYDSSSTPSGLPLSRTQNERIYLFIINNSSVGNDCIQTLYYTKQKITYRRFYTATEAVWSNWQKIINTPETLKNPNALTLTVNGTNIQYDGSVAKNSTWYAPTSIGNNGQILKSTGSGAPSWATPSNLTLTLNGSSSSYSPFTSMSKSWYAPTSSGTAGYELISNGSGNAPIWKAPSYAVCSTASGTAAKTVSITNFKLYTGAKITVKFTNSNSASSPTLDVSQTGAKPLRWSCYGDSLGGSYQVSGGATYDIMYDGTNWNIVVDHGFIENQDFIGNLMSWNIDQGLSIAYNISQCGPTDYDISAYLNFTNSGQLTIAGEKVLYGASTSNTITDGTTSWYAPTTAGTKGHQLVSNGSGAPIWEQPPYATCATASTTYTKAITISNFTPVAGKHIYVKFSNTSYSHVNTAISLSVNGTTNAVYKNGKAVTGTTMYAWLSNDIVEFMFDGSYWHIIQIVNRVQENNTVAHTINLDDNGVVINTSGYLDSDAWTKVLTIPGASSLDVTVIYQSESVSYDWGCIWAGNYPSYTAASNYATSLTNKLGGTTKTTANYKVQGDTITVAWKTDASSHNHYGFYVSIKPSPIGGISLSSDLTYETVTS